MNWKIIATLTIAIAFLAAFSATVVNAFPFPAVVGQIYTIDNAAAGNHVLVFNRWSDGSLTYAGTYNTYGDGTGAKLASQGAVILTSNGQWLLVVDAGSNQITVFQVQYNTITFADIVSSHGTHPISLTVNGNLVYVLNSVSDNIAGFWLSNNGMLTYIVGSSRPLITPSSPEQIGFNPRGNVLVVTDVGAGIIDTYTVNYNGIASAPMSTISAAAGPYGFAFNNAGYLVISDAAADACSSYAVSANGNLFTISSSVPDYGNAPCWVAITDNGKIAFAANAHGGTLSSYSISRSGKLTLLKSIAASTDIPALDLALSNGSQFLYSLNGDYITGFQVYADGSLSQVNMASVPAYTTGLAAT